MKTRMIPLGWTEHKVLYICKIGGIFEIFYSLLISHIKCVRVENPVQYLHNMPTVAIFSSSDVQRPELLHKSWQATDDICMYNIPYISLFESLLVTCLFYVNSNIGTLHHIKATKIGFLSPFLYFIYRKAHDGDED